MNCWARSAPKDAMRERVRLMENRRLIRMSTGLAWNGAGMRLSGIEVVLSMVWIRRARRLFVPEVGSSLRPGMESARKAELIAENRPA